MDNLERTEKPIKIIKDTGNKQRKRTVDLKEFPNYEEEIQQFSKDLSCLTKKPLSSKMFRVIEPENVIEFWDKLLRDRSEGAEKVRTFFQKTFEAELKLGKKMFARKLISARSPQCLSILSEEFPHFERSGLINSLREDLILSRLSGGVLSLTPTLMRSDAGFGKNRFVRHLGEVLGIPASRTFDFSSTTAGWVISGLNSSWSGSKTGEVFQTLTSSKGVANPLFFIDELEKGSSSSNTSRPLDCLHSILEKESARNFQDEFCPIPVNTSQVLWLAAANDLASISQSIISRFRVFEIPYPRPEEKRCIVKSIWCDLISMNSWGKYLSPKLPEEIFEQFEDESPRVIQRILRSCAARALAQSGGKPPKEKRHCRLKILFLKAKRM